MYENIIYIYIIYILISSKIISSFDRYLNDLFSDMIILVFTV